MNAHSPQPRERPVSRGQAPLRSGSGAPRGTSRAGGGSRPLVGKVHSPYSKAVSAPRRRGRWLTVGVPSVLGGSVGLGSFLVLGVSSLIGGAGLLVPLAAGVGVAAVVGGGTGLLLRNRSPQSVRLNRSGGEIPAATRATLEKIVKDSRFQRRRLHRMRRRAPSPVVRQILHRAETLLMRIDALLGSASLQARRSSDGDVMALEGMADRYIPDLVDALESTVGFLSPTTPEGARDKAVANLESIDEQLNVLSQSIDRIEDDIVSGVSRSLDVHSEFLRNRFSDGPGDPFSGR